MDKTSKELDKICTTLDKLTLDALTLIQEEIELKINAENAMIGGESHLAKTRYISGQNSVSNLQLPTENSPEIEALITVNSTTNENSNFKQFNLESKKPNETTYINPIKWFGFMPPQNLHLAQNLYRQALQWIIQATNIQNRLHVHLINIKQLKVLKNNLILTNNKKN